MSDGHTEDVSEISQADYSESQLRAEAIDINQQQQQQPQSKDTKQQCKQQSIDCKQQQVGPMLLNIYNMFYTRYICLSSGIAISNTIGCFIMAYLCADN